MKKTAKQFRLKRNSGRGLPGAKGPINRPPSDGHMAFVRSPDGISLEILQEGESHPEQEPWKSMENSGSW